MGRRIEPPDSAKAAPTFRERHIISRADIRLLDELRAEGVTDTNLLRAGLWHFTRLSAHCIEKLLAGDWDNEAGTNIVENLLNLHTGGLLE